MGQIGFMLIVLILAVMLGGGLVPLFRIKSGTGLKLILAYSGAYILALCLFHLLPEVYSGIKNPSLAGALILGGFFLQLVLDYISGGIEHGHVHLPEELHSTTPHQHDHPQHVHENSIQSRFPWLMMIGLCIHGFVEGIPLMFVGTGKGLFIGILLHNIPISITLMSLFLSGKSLFQSFVALFVFSLMTPAGALIAFSFFQGGSAIATDFGYYGLALIIGIFFHISTTILFESDQNHRFNLIKFITILLGSATALLLN
jgi:zinc and cadmium transporter